MSYILVVDDDASHRTLICDALEEMGYRTKQAANGREALDSLEVDIPQAVLLDLRMPVMSGWGLLDALKKMPRARGLPIIIISGSISGNRFRNSPISAEMVRSGTGSSPVPR